MTDEKKIDAGDLAERAGDMAGGALGVAAAATAGARSDPEFIKNAAVGDLYEIEAAKLALRRGRSEDVRRMARVLLEDHTTSLHNLKSALRMNEVSGRAPEQLDQRRRKLVEHLEQAPDDEFDRRFLEQQVLAHQESVTLFKGYAAHGSNPQLKSLAAATLPTLERHLKHVRDRRH